MRILDGDERQRRARVWKMLNLEKSKRGEARAFVEKYSWDDIVDEFEVEIKKLKLKEDLKERL